VYPVGCSHIPVVYNKSFSRQSILNIHNTYIVNSSHIPVTCDESLRLQVLLKLHQCIHRRVWPYSCDVYNKSFGKHSNLKIHQHIHSEQHSYCCTESERECVCVCMRTCVINRSGCQFILSYISAHIEMSGHIPVIHVINCSKK
jgi:hypothetical protein